MRHPQALGQQQLQFAAEPLAPMAQVGALVRERVLEELLAGEVLEIGVVDPAFADTFVGSRNVLEQQQTDHEAALDPRAAFVAVERRDLCVDPRPVDLAASCTSSCRVDDLVEPGPEQIAFPCRLVLLRPHRPLQCGIESRLAERGNPKTKSQGSSLTVSQEEFCHPSVFRAQQGHRGRLATRAAIRRRRRVAIESGV
jgi:hypothetical protein